MCVWDSRFQVSVCLFPLNSEFKPQPGPLFGISVPQMDKMDNRALWTHICSPWATHAHACTHAHAHAHTHTLRHAHTCVHTHTCAHTHTHACAHMHTCARTRACTHAHTHTRTHTQLSESVAEDILLTHPEKGHGLAEGAGESGRNARSNSQLLGKTD